MQSGNRPAVLGVGEECFKVPEIQMSVLKTNGKPVWVECDKLWKADMRWGWICRQGLSHSFLFFKRERGGGKEGERGREASMWERTIWDRNIHWLPSICHDQGPNLQPRHGPWLGIEPVTFWFARKCPFNWATLARAGLSHSFPKGLVYAPLSAWFLIPYESQTYFIFLIVIHSPSFNLKLQILVLAYVFLCGFAFKTCFLDISM